jgi:uncharacterized sporulation protein YeaH/YhbH (DUF444 family)
VQIIDRRRMSRSKTTENRSRFIKRYKDTIKKTITDTFMNQKLSDTATSGGKAKLSGKTLKEPVIHHGEGGIVDRVLPGNRHYSEGDMLPKPDGGGGIGDGDGAGTGSSMDEFTIVLDNKEFLDLLFDDLELPRLTKTMLLSAKTTAFKNAGFTPDGNPSNLSVIRTYKQALARRICIKGSIEEELSELAFRIIALDGMIEPANRIYDLEISDELAALYQLYDDLKSRQENIPLFDDNDLRFRAKVKVETPSTHATMVMLMDNSGSMGEREKTIARKFFLLLYLFLRRTYDDVAMVFISHTTDAKELTEEEFFNTRESGGTLVSSGLDLMHGIIDERLLDKTNIYVAQVSDGDNMDNDNGTCVEILEDDILPHARYYAYVQVDDYHTSDIAPYHVHGKGLWKAYEGLSKKISHFNVKRVSDEKDIYPVFRELFSKQQS